ncbi:hypothetical protein FJR45_09610 [Sulfurimonas sediminis]|uniref:Uncharacterized protein n=1 Tax=Sulfurimonas sediminis TaxID=2590020 RepID=A0A7M1B395_9BACT|nr:hypothetical protein [Sulfurimonas sediminis]QOP44184.1 hypothetical protein FJR45_09610 [Sulfurimonas sediminis]
MAKVGNPKLSEIAKSRKERTEYLIREAVRQLENTFEMKSIKAVAAKTKEIDETGKGISEATFRNKELVHIQSLMIELRIGKYEAIAVSSSVQERSMADELLNIKKELKKKELEMKKIKERNKKLKDKVNELTFSNEELRTALYEMEFKQKMKLNFTPKNNNI